ncbi:MAG: hypothetical protein ACKVPY_12630 [Paracoccaceae bacterium]
MAGRIERRIAGPAAGLALLAALAACTRDPPRVTECLGNVPAAERSKDVAPPNCDPVLPGVPQPSAAPLDATAPAPAPGA